MPPVNGNNSAYDFSRSYVPYGLVMYMQQIKLVCFYFRLFCNEMVYSFILMARQGLLNI